MYLLIGKTDDNCNCSFGIFECERKSQIRCVCLKKTHYIMITALFRIFFFFFNSVDRSFINFFYFNKFNQIQLLNNLLNLLINRHSRTFSGCRPLSVTVYKCGESQCRMHRVLHLNSNFGQPLICWYRSVTIICSESICNQIGHDEWHNGIMWNF